VTSAAAGSDLVSLAADPSGQLSYTRTTLKAKAGAVAIDFTNASPLPHNVTVAASDGRVIGATPTFRGSARTLQLNLQPGTYIFYCSVPGHRGAGMKGTLVVARLSSR
jgi:plastocyanin